MRLNKTCVATAFVLIAGSAVAAEISGPMGAGEITCGEYLKAHTVPAERDVYAQWSSGVIVGIISITSQRIPPELTVERVARHLQAFCKADPSQSLFVAAASMSREYQVKP
jgi:hypothetical protein